MKRSALFLAAVMAAAQGRAETVEERLDRLEKRQAVFETVKLGGIFQVDGRFFLSDQPKSFTDTFTLAKVRPIFEGSVQKVADFRIMPDFGGGTTAIQDAYVDLKYIPAARLRLGKFKVPLGLERLQGDTVLLFIERGFPAALLPSRDVGVQASGDVFRGALAWQAGVFNGAPDGGNADGDVNDDKEVMGRLFLQAKGFGVGAAYGRSTAQGTPAAPALPSYRTNGLQTFLSYRSDVLADGTRTRLVPQVYWYPGRWSFLTEYASSAQQVKRGTTTFASTTFAELESTAWQVSVGFALTGEKSSYKGIKPAKPFDRAAGGWGAVELAVRYSEFNTDDDAFPQYANPATAARSARLVSGGMNWYLNAQTRVSANYDHTRFTRGAATGDRDDERYLSTRFQLTY